MRVGDAVIIRECGSMPEVVGEIAEIVEMQMQEYEKYRTYPVWAKMTSGELKGRIYGFRESEVELPLTMEKGRSKMRIGDTVRIRECDSMPGVVGENGEVVDTEIQQFAKYTVYPIWVKITSGECAGKVYGFREGEMELLAKGVETPEVTAKGEARTISTKVIEQMEEILRGVATLEEIADVERVIEEAKGKILAEPRMGFWEGKTPCWEMLRCPEAMRDECPAFKYRSLPCWEIEGTYCKLDDFGTTGQDTAICEVCRVYKRWGHGEPIEIKLFGRGIDTSLASLLGLSSLLDKEY